MRASQHLFPAILVVFYFATGSSVFSNTTIERSDFPRSASFLDEVSSTTQPGVVAPGEGAMQTWDYTDLIEQEQVAIHHMDAGSSVDFPGALNFYQDDLSFQGFPIPGKTYEAIDDDGWYDLGREISDVTYSITFITGGAGDLLRFPASVEIFNNRIDLIKFPLNYQDQWTESRLENFNFELTVAAFGLNQVPGNLKRTLTHQREVVGYGKLTIPKSDGTPSNNIDVLQIKVHRMAIDSFFLGGLPAPTALLIPFGLSQGSVAADSFYVFYRAGFAAPVLNINLGTNNTVVSSFFRPQAAEGVGCPVPQNQTSTDITDKQARLAWDHVADADRYVIIGNKVGESTIKAITRKKNFVKFKRLTANTSYYWKVQSVCDFHQPPVSSFSAQTMFTTSPSSAIKISFENSNDATLDRKNILLYPNPTKGSVYVSIDGKAATVEMILYDNKGVQLMSQIGYTHSGPIKYQLPNYLTNGLYIIQFNLESETYNEKIFLNR